MSPKNKITAGSVFDTVFWVDKQDEQGPRLVGRNINSAWSTLPIVSKDCRMLPGRRYRVRVDQVTDKEIRVCSLGLVDFRLEDNIYIEPSLLKHFEILLCGGRSILLEGPHGTGKSTIAEALARTLGMKYVFFNCSVCFEPSDFAGSFQLLVDENNNTRAEWLPSEVLKGVVEACENPDKRYLIFLDQLSRTHSYALNGIMRTIDSTRRIFDPRINSYVSIPDNVQWIAAVDWGKSITGIHHLELTAQLDRFAVLMVDYPPEKEEIRILSNRYGEVPARHIRKVVSIAQVLRSEVNIISGLSMRATDEACFLLSHPRFQKRLSRKSMLDILKICFCNRLIGNPAEEGSEANIAFGIIERMIGQGKQEH